MIAVRHGRHIKWFSPTHGLAKKRPGTVKLSSDVRFGAGIRAFGQTSAPVVTGVGPCSFNSQSTNDGMSYVQSYGSLYSDVLSCVGNNGGSTESNAFFPSPACTNNGAQSDQKAPLEYATFMDGEWIVLCSVPDDNGSGGSQANSQAAPYAIYQQGFKCEAAVGIGPSDSTAHAYSNDDSLEYSQTYNENGQATTAVTTTCVGRVPNGTTVASSPVYHEVSCTEYDPQNPGQVLRGIGETITYPDHQYQETCNVPGYEQTVACVPGQSCPLTLTSSSSTVVIDVNPNGTVTSVTGAVDPGTALSCAAPQFGGYTGFDPNWYGWSITGSGAKVIRYDLVGQFPALSSVQFCFGGSTPFATTTGTSQPGTLPDGTQGYIGLIPMCSSSGYGSPCIDSKSYYPSTGTPQGTQIAVDVPQSFGGDPWGRA